MGEMWEAMKEIGKKDKFKESFPKSIEKEKEIIDQKSRPKFMRWAFYNWATVISLIAILIYSYNYAILPSGTVYRTGMLLNFFAFVIGGIIGLYCRYYFKYIMKDE